MPEPILIAMQSPLHHGLRGPQSTRSTARLRTGGADGNELLTSLTGAILIVLLAVIGLTIIALHQLLSVHLFVGLVLVGPLLLKMGSTGYRFVRYYTGNAALRGEGAAAHPAAPDRADRRPLDRVGDGQRHLAR